MLLLLSYCQAFVQEEKLLSRLETLENQLETLTRVSGTGSTVVLYIPLLLNCSNITSFVCLGESSLQKGCCW